jgi:hypothetical protein
MNESTLETLAGRVGRLEGQVRRWRRGAMVVVAVGAVVALALTMRVSGQAVPKPPVSATPRVIEAEKFIVKDRDGRIRVVLGPAFGWVEAGTETAALEGRTFGLHVYESEGMKLGLLANQEGSSSAFLELRDKKTPSSARVMVSSGLSSLSLSATEVTREVAERRDAEWDEKYKAAKTEQERTSLFESHPFDGVTARLVAFPKGASTLALERGTLTNPQSSGAQLYLLRDGRVSFSLVDERGKERAVLGQTSLERKATGIVEQLPVASLVLFDKEGKVLWKAP